MAEEKGNADQASRPSKKESEGREQRQDIAEESPNPHNEANVIEMPIRTDQNEHTGDQNVAQTPNTRDGRLHPSVGESVGGVADTDSMFNKADPQSREENAGQDKRKRKKSRKPA